MKDKLSIVPGSLPATRVVQVVVALVDPFYNSREFLRDAKSKGSASARKKLLMLIVCLSNFSSTIGNRDRTELFESECRSTFEAGGDN